MRRSEKIYYDLSLSEEYFDINELGYRFYFSSSFNKDRFINGYKDFVKLEEDKIISRYKIKISLRFYLTIVFYLKIEKRGFRLDKYCEKTGDYSLSFKKDDIIFTEIEV